MLQLCRAQPVFAILIANIDKKNESSKLLGEKLLIEPYTWENCQKGFSNVVQFYRSNLKYSKSIQNFFRSNNSSWHRQVTGSAFLQEKSYFIVLDYTLHSDRPKRPCTKGSCGVEGALDPTLTPH